MTKLCEQGCSETVGECQVFNADLLNLLQDARIKARVQSRQKLEGYAYQLRNTVQNNDEQGLGDKLSEEDLETITEAVTEVCETRV